MRRRKWYDLRTAKDAPNDLFDQAWDKAEVAYGRLDAWAQGYNAAVQAYIDELNDAAKDELRVPGWRR